MNSQCSQNKHGCQMDLDDHVEVLVHKSVHHVAHEDKHSSGKIDLQLKLVFVDLCFRRFVELTVKKVENNGLPSMISTTTPCKPSIFV